MVSIYQILWREGDSNSPVACVLEFYVLYRASVFLRMGRFQDAMESFDEATVLNIYGLGNELSDLHETRQEMEPYLPEWSGPPLNIQRGEYLFII